jgi:hypothetical protein
MGGLRGGGEGIAQGRESVAVGEGICSGKVGSQNTVQKGFLNEIRVTMRLNRGVDEIHQQYSTDGESPTYRQDRNYSSDSGLNNSRRHCLHDCVVHWTLGVQVKVREGWVY